MDFEGVSSHVGNGDFAIADFLRNPASVLCPDSCLSLAELRLAVHQDEIHRGAVETRGPLFHKACFARDKATQARASLD